MAFGVQQDGREPSVRLSIVIPFHHNLDQLRRCVDALGLPSADRELVVVADAARQDCREVVESRGGQVIELTGPPAGPAVARNRGAAAATGDVLVFIDTDVVAAPDALTTIAAILSARTDVAAVFGAYDEEPGDSGFMSQFKNLGHAYVHVHSNPEAQTFWAGLGAVRAGAFAAVDGFDERFRRPSVEDIDLGYRLRAAGYRIVLASELRGCHLKRWTFGGAIISDIRDRGVPWTQLLLRFGRFDNDLNLSTGHRLSVAASYGTVVCAGLAAFDARFLIAMMAMLAGVAVLGRDFYAYFAARRGVWFALRAFPAHLVHHLCNGVSFAAGTVLYSAARWRGITLPGALPIEPWRAQTSKWAPSLPSNPSPV